MNIDAKKDRKGKKSWKERAYKEMKGYWFNVIFLACFFGIFTTYRRLILAHYDIDYTEYGVSLIKALILAKVILIGEALRIGRKFEDQPLIFPTLYRSLIFTVFVAFFSVVESLVRSFWGGQDWQEALYHLLSHFNYEWLAQLFIIFLFFIPFLGIRELGRILGPGEIGKIFFLKKGERSRS